MREGNPFLSRQLTRERTVRMAFGEWPRALRFYGIGGPDNNIVFLLHEAVCVRFAPSRVQLQLIAELDQGLMRCFDLAFFRSYMTILLYDHTITKSLLIKIIQQACYYCVHCCFAIIRVLTAILHELRIGRGFWWILVQKCHPWPST